VSLLNGPAGPDLQKKRRELLDAPHARPLTELIHRMRSERPKEKIPYFDPLDAGEAACLLILLEAPGPKAVESGFISLDNPDPTARNLKSFLAMAAVPRSVLLLWNIVPWYLSTPGGGRIRAARYGDLEAARQYLRALIELLPNLTTVLLLGSNAQKGWERLGETSCVRVFRTYHTSNQVFALDPSRRDQVRQELERVREHLDLTGVTAGDSGGG
jgi:uracil-DNA glycosylase